jgi:hypothetical protein
MVALVETTWLFVRGAESVRMIRAATPEGRARLLIYGPGNTQSVLEFQDKMACSTAESDLEERLVKDGFTLNQFTDRRNGEERRITPRGPDRRR